MTGSEDKMLRKIRRFVGTDYKTYDFCFVYDENGDAISWEGGFGLGQHGHFRNQYTVAEHKQLIKNW